MLERVPIDVVKIALDQYGMTALTEEWTETPLPVNPNLYELQNRPLEVHHLHPVKSSDYEPEYITSHIISTGFGRASLRRYRHSHYLDIALGQCECGAILWGVTRAIRD
jgi:hypothetical protein